jgi:phage shock protein C
MTKRLSRSSSNKVIAGICGGLGDHFDVDPTLIRLIAVVGALASIGGIVLFYVIAWIVIPQAEPGEVITEQDLPTDPFVVKTRSGWRLYLPGLILVVLGIMFLLPEYIPGFHWHDIWPLILVLLGLMLILRNGRKSKSSTVPPIEGPGAHGRDGGIHS